MTPGLARIDAAAVAAARARLPAAFGASPGRRLARAALWCAFAAWLVTLLWWFGFSPARIWNGIGGVLTILRLMVPPSPGEHLDDILKGMGESVAMAFLGTVMAAIVAVPLGFLGAVDQLIWALAYVRAVGLGPLAGVLAIFTADIAVLAKLYAEAIENAERRQTDGVLAAGAGKTLIIRFGLLPQVLPVMLAQALYFFESNTRSAAILGIVGAGGIGLQIAERIRIRAWDEVAFIILLILVTVAAIDTLSSRIRLRLIGAQSAR